MYYCTQTTFFTLDLFASIVVLQAKQTSKEEIIREDLQNYQITWKNFKGLKKVEQRLNYGKVIVGYRVIKAGFYYVQIIVHKRYYYKLKLS